jgi:hypothetical protein
MSTINLATLQSNTALPPTIQNSSAVEIGTFCRAWVNFNGSGVVAIRASFNVTSITDNGTGDYTVNFTTAMSDANYAITGSANVSTASYNIVLTPNRTTAPTSSACRVVTSSGAGATFFDCEFVYVAIFR